MSRRDGYAQGHTPTPGEVSLILILLAVTLIAINKVLHGCATRVRTAYGTQFAVV